MADMTGARADGIGLDQVRWANQTVVTRRLEIFSEIAPALNKLLCFATFVGRWKEIEPQHAIDADAHLRAPIESQWGNRRNMTWWQDGRGASRGLAGGSLALARYGRCLRRVCAETRLAANK
jgi:hypothetical protein